MRPTPHNLSKLQSLLSQLKDQTSSAKLHYEQDIAMDRPNKIFKYIKSLTSAPPVPPIVSFDSSTTSTDSEKVLLFNKVFHSVFTLSAYQLPPLHESASSTPTLSDIGISDPMCLKPCVHWIQLKPLESTVSVQMFFITVHLLSTNLSITYSYLAFPTPTFLQNGVRTGLQVW